MTRQTPSPIEPARLSATNRSARELARLAEDGTIDINTPYQRGDVWTLDQRIALVRSWMLGLPIPAVFVNDRMGRLWAENNPDNNLDVCYGCIDGKQRLTTAIMWFFGELLVPASWFNPDDVQGTRDTEDGPYVTFADLTRGAQADTGFSWTIPLAEAKVGTVQEEAEIYLLVNGGGTPQSDADMDNARRIAEAS